MYNDLDLSLKNLIYLPTYLLAYYILVLFVAFDFNNVENTS